MDALRFIKGAGYKTCYGGKEVNISVTFTMSAPLCREALLALWALM